MPRHPRTTQLALIWLACSLALSGCQTAAYSCGRKSDYITSPQLTNRPQIERGRPNALADGFGWAWGIPLKIILFDRRVENHRVSRSTEAALAEYLAANQLSSVKVRLNQYHPRDDWKRLRQNTAVGGGWRYTLGVLSVAGETILPGRLFGGDHYNPFTNTIHVYSDVPAIAVHEGGHAKDFAQRTWKGTWAAFYLVPGASLWHEAIATSDALTWLAEDEDPEALREGYRILYPAYGTYVGSAISDPTGLSYLAGVLAGHAAGRWQAARVPNRPPVRSRPPTEPGPEQQRLRPEDADPNGVSDQQTTVGSAAEQTLIRN